MVIVNRLKVIAERPTGASLTLVMRLRETRAEARLVMQRSRSPAMPCGFGGAVSNLGDDEGILARSGIFGL
jgi:hypothetical protein